LDWGGGYDNYAQYDSDEYTGACIDSETFTECTLFGALKLDTSLDCSFSNPNGLACLISIISVCVLGACAWIKCMTMKKDERYETFCRLVFGASCRQATPLEQYVERQLVPVLPYDPATAAHYTQVQAQVQPQQQAFPAQPQFVPYAQPPLAVTPPVVDASL
jgi:hypothetical protein